MSPDSGVDQHPEAPQSWNLYGYALNNPLNLVDPTGEYVCGSGITQTMCDNFQKSLDAAQADANKLKDTYGADSSEYKDAQRAIDFYGKENIDNGVTLTLGGQPKGAEGQVDPRSVQLPRLPSIPAHRRLPSILPKAHSAEVPTARH